MLNRFEVLADIPAGLEKGLHIKVDIVPEEYVAESVVAALRGEDLHGQRFLLPRAEVARDVIPSELAKLGAKVDVVAAYRNVIPEKARDQAKVIFS